MMISESPSNQPDWVSDLADLSNADAIALAEISRIFGDFRRVFAISPEKRMILWDSIIQRSPEPTTEQRAG